MITLAIDPGTEQSGCVWLDRQVVQHSMILTNETLRDLIYFAAYDAGNYPHPDDIVIEAMRSSNGMPVGAETLETVHWSGRFYEAAMSHYTRHCVGRLYRMDVKMYWCQSARAKDQNVWMAVKDHFGGDKAIGRKKTPGPLYGIRSHCQQALALGLAWQMGVMSEGI